MENKDFIQKLILEFNFIESLYESIRLINPIEKTVYGIIKSTNAAINAEDTCYHIWKDHKICDNCISIRAYQHNKSFTKIEYTASNIYIVTAVPINHEHVVIEFLQNISSDYFYHDKNFNDIIKLIKKENIAVVRNTLTNLYNDQFVLERLPCDIAASYKEGIHITLFLIKIQNMDFINRTFGYPAGDQVIKEVAKVLKGLSLQERDWVSSYRGIRFILVRYGISESQVGRSCHHIFEQVKGLKLSWDGYEITPEISIGYHILREKMITPDQFIEKAKGMLAAESKFDKKDNNIRKLMQTYSFTYREKEIILLLFEGKSNIEIANALYIGLSTVKKHISALLGKMAVKSRTELVVKLNDLSDPAVLLKS